MEGPEGGDRGYPYKFLYGWLTGMEKGNRIPTGFYLPQNERIRNRHEKGEEK